MHTRLISLAACLLLLGASLPPAALAQVHDADPEDSLDELSSQDASLRGTQLGVPALAAAAPIVGLAAVSASRTPSKKPTFTRSSSKPPTSTRTSSKSISASKVPGPSPSQSPPPPSAISTMSVTPLPFATPSPSSKPSVARTVNAYITFYGSNDNCPPGPIIAYPTLHAGAGGTGTYADPITYAGAAAATPAGTIIYVPSLTKYFIMEDDCAECDRDWKKSKAWHFDLWMGPQAVTNGTALIGCQDQLTVTSAPVIISPASELAVDATPLFDGTTLQCIVPVTTTCVATSNACGNSCFIPVGGSCADIATLLGLTQARFTYLNPTISCASDLAVNTNVCMGDICGG